MDKNATSRRVSKQIHELELTYMDNANIWKNSQMHKPGLDAYVDKIQTYGYAF